MVSYNGLQYNNGRFNVGQFFSKNLIENNFADDVFFHPLPGMTVKDTIKLLSWLSTEYRPSNQQNNGSSSFGD